MTYQQPFQQGPQLSQVIRRQMTPEELQLPGRFYKGLQNGLRGISLFCLILFVFSSYVMPSMISDPITYDTLSIVLTMFMAAFGIAAIGMSVNSLTIRKKISQVMSEGTAIEVTAPAYKTGAMRKGQGWTVGPISLLPTMGLDGLVTEGMPTKVLCVPRLKAALAINNVGLRKGARIMCPPNLDAMATPMSTPFAGEASGMPYPPSGQSLTTPQYQTEDTEELPPPPPPID